MELGLFLMPLHRPDSFHADTYDQDLNLMEVADDLGYTESWIGEHFTMPWG
jgi:alkanesulfonate monooxygenase SsuD/methylene tetrahydromethanopterin reductase-like flavin-dependent oxidoreductase (luciferase family)